MGFAVAPKAHAASLKRAGIGAPGAFDRLATAVSLVSLQDAGYISMMRPKSPPSATSGIAYSTA